MIHIVNVTASFNSPESAHLPDLERASRVCLGQDVGAEGVARVGVSNVRVSGVVGSLSIAGGSAKGRVDRAGLKELVAKVALSVLAVVEGSV